MVAALIYLDGQGVVLRVLLACVLHELGHWTAVRLLGGRVQALRLTAVGAEMVLDSGRALSYGREAAAAFAGPAVNLLLAWVSAQTGRYLFAGINLCLGLINLLPIRRLDGARVLYCLLSLCRPELAQRVMAVLSPAFSGAILGLGWAAWRAWDNLSLLCVALWLTAGLLK